MSANVNYTATGTDFGIEADVDTAFDDDSYLKFKAALDGHDHSATRGLAVARLASSVAGTPTFSGAVAVTGLLTASAGLYLPAAASRIYPGVTSLSLRNNADSADNLIITDAGAATFRSTVTATGLLTASAGLTVTGNLTMATAASRIVPGATSFAIRNNGNGVDNLLISNAGDATLAGSLTMTVGNLIFLTANSRIIPGATSLVFRDAANANTNVTITDAGVATIRAGLVVSTGGAAITGASSIIGTLTLTNAGATLFSLNAAYTDHAGPSAGSLTNAPTPGNPTKWLAINDNGTVRKFPTWT